jgi:hypothetical protein
MVVGFANTYAIGVVLFPQVPNQTIQHGWFGLVLWCLMPLSTIFQFYRGSQSYWWKKL